MSGSIGRRRRCDDLHDLHNHLDVSPIDLTSLSLRSDPPPPPPPPPKRKKLWSPSALLTKLFSHRERKCAESAPPQSPSRKAAPPQSPWRRPRPAQQREVRTKKQDVRCEPAKLSVFRSPRARGRCRSPFTPFGVERRALAGSGQVLRERPPRLVRAYVNGDRSAPTSQVARHALSASCTCSACACRCMQS